MIRQSTVLSVRFFNSQVVAVILSSLVSVCHPFNSAPAQQPQLIVENAGWCWFQTERALGSGSKVYLTSIAGHDGRGGRKSGDLVATSYDVETNNTVHYTLHPSFQSDDHDVAGLCLLADQRLLAVYGKHGSDQYQRWRITEKPHDISTWSDERAFSVGAPYTYSNVFRLTAENDRIFNFHRGLGYNPNCNISNDNGATWKYGWRLVEWNKSQLINDPRYTGRDGGRPYVRYASNGLDEIHFLLTDDHPRAYDNSIYHGFYKSGKLFQSSGEVVSNLLSNPNSAPEPAQFTEVFAGNANQVAWCNDLSLDAHGAPVATFSVQLSGAPYRSETQAPSSDHAYYYARWLNNGWQTHFLAHAGSRLYSGEDDYTGLSSIDPENPNFVVISTNSNPESGQPLISQSDQQRHWEIYLGVTSDFGTTWQWKALTRDSQVDNLRPVIVPGLSNHRVILWCQGILRSYTDFELDLVALSMQRK
ncbi:MAG: BNR-4 repeat-containing protein [Planctomycetales bacterium]|nr:BNR-4 repeat-containing protein [Planctomycetales bacterium]